METGLKYSLPLERAEKFEEFLVKKGFEILSPKDGRDWEAFRATKEKVTSIFFAFKSTNTLESYDEQGQDLFKQFLSGGVRLPIHA